VLLAIPVAVSFGRRRGGLLRGDDSHRLATQRIPDENRPSDHDQGR
jgi:hypothetical protein